MVSWSLKAIPYVLQVNNGCWFIHLKQPLKVRSNQPKCPPENSSVKGMRTACSSLKGINIQYLNIQRVLRVTHWVYGNSQKDSSLPSCHIWTLVKDTLGSHFNSTNVLFTLPQLLQPSKADLVVCWYPKMATARVSRHHWQCLSVIRTP